jgi:excisionase family DNA binding protein
MPLGITGAEVRHVAKMLKNYRDTTPETQQSAHVALAWGKQLLTLNDAAQYAICTPRYLQHQIRAGRLKALKPTAKFLRIRRAELDRFLESGATMETKP